MKKYLLLTLMVSAFCSTNSQAQTYQQLQAAKLARMATKGDFTPSPSFCAPTNTAFQIGAIQNCIINGGGQQMGCTQSVITQCEKFGFKLHPKDLA